MKHGKERLAKAEGSSCRWFAGWLFIPRSRLVAQRVAEGKLIRQTASIDQGFMGAFS
jgi:hypothetical protein